MNVTELIPSLPLTNPVLIFFIVLIIILFAPLLLNRLRIPHIIGLIVAGIIIGPNGFDILQKDSSFEIFGKVGLLYLMFLAGLEMDINDFKKKKSQGITFGIYTFLVPMIIGTVVSYYTLNLDFMSSILLASMYASHTLIAYPIVSRYGLGRHPAVTITLAGTIITVMGALIILAVIAGIAQGDHTGHIWSKLFIGITLYTSFIIYAFPRIARWFFKKHSDNVSQYIFVLALAFFASFLAEFIGLEAIIGAFLAGVVLNRFIPAVSPLMNRIEFVGNAIFIPYFLIGVGMLIDLKAFVASREALFVAVNMTIVATACKWIAAWLTQKTFHLSRLDRSMIFGLSNAQAAATLAAVLIGYDLGLFDNNILNGTIIMILGTCTISSFVTEKAAREIATQQTHEDVVAQSPNIKDERILIPVSNPETVEKLVNMALLLKNPKSKRPIYALSVSEDNMKENYGKRILETAGRIASAADIPVETIQRYDINIGSGIIHTIKERNITEVIVGLHRKSNLVDSFFGHKTMNLLKNTNRMIFITKCHIPANTITRIVIAVPEKAEYETGFAKWIDRIANMARQIGCRVIFYAHPRTITQLQAVIKHGRYNIRSEFEILENWEEILMLAGVVLQDDLFIIVSARRTSISFNPEFDNLPDFLTRYFAGNNLILLFPEQFGEESDVVFFSDPLNVDVQRNYTHFISPIRKFFIRVLIEKKRWTHRNRKSKL